MAHVLFDRHKKMLEDAVVAIRSRTYWSAYPEVPSGKIYGETAKEDGYAAYKDRLNKPFELDQPGCAAAVGGEVSPYGMALGITYSKADLDQLLPAVATAGAMWRKVDVGTRVGVCLEILARINKRSFEMANAVMHTTGQGFMMAFQAGGPHAQDRGLEAVACAYEEITRIPSCVTWSKKVSKTDTVDLEKRFHIVPRGIAVVIGCSTFPTWNTYPGLFASLATGNPVIVKPHPGAILPLAITVEIAREVLREHDFDANVVTLVADSHEEPIAKQLVTRDEVRIVDYTGSSEFGDWIETNARQAVVFTEKAGVNSVVIDSAHDLKAVTGNLAFSLSLYSGQMCTTPQNIFIPAGGIAVGDEHKSFDEVVQAIMGAIDWLLGDAKRGAEILGAIQNPNTVSLLEKAVRDGGQVLREATPVSNERFPDARVRSPMVVKVSAADKQLYMREVFGPLVYVIATADTDESVTLAVECARTHGAITAAVYSTNDGVLAAVRDKLADAGAAVSCNLTGQIFMNQSAAFSDYHVSGANPAGNATLCDAAFVVGRFGVTQSRTPVDR